MSTLRERQDAVIKTAEFSADLEDLDAVLGDALDLLDEMAAPMQEFVDRVDSGSVRSRYTVAKFRKVLAKYEGKS